IHFFLAVQHIGSGYEYRAFKVAQCDEVFFVEEERQETTKFLFLVERYPSRNAPQKSPPSQRRRDTSDMLTSTNLQLASNFAYWLLSRKHARYDCARRSASQTCNLDPAFCLEILYRFSRCEKSAKLCSPTLNRQLDS